MSTTTFDYDVAIVGEGPTGVTAANQLGHYGIRTLVIERDADVFFRARAVTVDASTLRVFQALGLDEALKADMDRTPALRWKTYAGLEFLRVAADFDVFGQPSSSMIYQPAVEATLREGVGRYPSVEVRYGVECTGLVQDGAGVTVRINEVATRVETSSRVKYVIAADGGSSRVRRDLGIDNIGSTKSRTWVVVDAKVLKTWPDRELLTFWSDPDRPVVDIPLALGHHRWEIPLREGEKNEDFESDEAIWKLIAPLGVGPENVQLQHRAFYSHHVRHAERWREGRVLLAGDAAHLMPPWAGQGMQSGIRDAVNLSWKLRAILQHGAGDDLLDTYEPERAPHVEEVTNASIGLGRLIEVEKGPMRTFRDRIIPLVRKIPVVGRNAFSGGVPWLHITTGFVTGIPHAKKNALGTLVPQPKVSMGGADPVLLDDVLGLDFAVLGNDIDPRSLMSARDQQDWEGLGARFHTIRPVGADAAPSDLVDVEAELTRWFEKTARARVVVVRPDRLVAAADPSGLEVPGSEIELDHHPLKGIR